jgi:hypothetical protein
MAAVVWHVMMSLEGLMAEVARTASPLFTYSLVGASVRAPADGVGRPRSETVTPPGPKVPRWPV